MKHLTVTVALPVALLGLLLAVGITRLGSTASADQRPKVYGFYAVGAIPEQTEIPDGDSVAMEALCDIGDEVTGGGYVTNSSNTGFLVTANEPFSARIWRVTVKNQSGGPLLFRVTARCVDLTP